MNDGRINWIERNPSAVAEKLIRVFAEAGVIVSVETSGMGVYTVSRGSQSAQVTAEEIAYELNVRVSMIVTGWEGPLPFSFPVDDPNSPPTE